MLDSENEDLELDKEIPITKAMVFLGQEGLTSFMYINSHPVTLKKESKSGPLLSFGSPEKKI